MSTQANDTNTTKLINLIKSIQPIFVEMEKLITEAKELETTHKNHFNYLGLHFKMEKINANGLLTEKHIEQHVKFIGTVLDHVGKIMTDVSDDQEESHLYYESGVMEKLQAISQKMTMLIS